MKKETAIENELVAKPWEHRVPTQSIPEPVDAVPVFTAKPKDFAIASSVMKPEPTARPEPVIKQKPVKEPEFEL
jgi:hypothetical protein